jgi:hypothetical protein
MHSWQRELAHYLFTQRFNFMLTVNYPKARTGPIAAERDQVLLNDLKQWTRRILERLYGKKFVARNADDAFFYAAFAQTGPLLGKGHWHILVRVPFRLWSRFARYAKREWKTTPDIEFSLIEDAVAAVNYCTRKIASDPDRVWYSNQFRHSKAA